MTILRFSDPAGRLMSLQRELDQVFDKPFGVDLGMSGRGVFPPINVFTDADGHVIRAEVPGVAPEQIQIETRGHTLTIAGKRTFEPPAAGGFHRRERGLGDFSRSIHLPADSDLGRTQASYKNGLLTIRVPKREEARPRKVTVQSE